MNYYIFLIVLVSLFAVFEKKKDNKIGLEKRQGLGYVSYILLTFVLSFFAAARYDTGSDCLSYYNYFDYIKSDDTDLIFMMYEPGFAYLYLLLGQLFNTGQSLIVVTSVLTNVFIANVIRRVSPMPFLSLFCYVCFYYYFLSFNILRQFLGISIVLCGLPYLLEKTKKGNIIFVACCLVATLFHLSAILSLIMLFFVRLSHNMVAKISLFILIITGFISSSYYIDLFSSFARFSDFYGGKYGTQNSSSSSVVILSVFLLICWFFENKYKKQIKAYNFYENCLAFGLFLNVIAGTNAMFGRIAMYYTIVLLILVPLFISNLKNSFVFKILVIVVAIAYCVWNLSNNNGGVVPYHFCF